MAGYSGNREDNFDSKVLRKALLAVDDRIVVPDSVRGDALRRKLDQVQPPEPAAPDKKSGIVFGLKWFSLHSGLTYAAAFALIVGLFYGLGLHHQPDMVDGQMALPEGQEYAEQYELAEFQLLIEGDDAVYDSGEDPANPMSGGGGGMAPATFDMPLSAPAEDSAPITPRGLAPATGGVGGGGESEKLGSQNGYSYAWRSNDASDPDKGHYPVTVEVINDEAEQPVATIDIPDIQAIETVHFSDSTLSLVGTTAQGVVTRTYNIEAPESPTELVVLEQPGAYVSSRLHNNVVHTVTYSDEVNNITFEAEVLPGAVSSDTACVVSAVDTVALATNQKAFLGADQDISLLERGAYVTYEAETASAVQEALEEAPTEETAPQEVAAGEAQVTASAPESAQADMEQADIAQPEGVDETATYYAQIVLNGTDITLGSVTQ